MAGTVCPECGKEINDEVKKICPNCGYSFEGNNLKESSMIDKEHSNEQNNYEKLTLKNYFTYFNKFSNLRKDDKKKFIIITVSLLFIVLAFFMIIIPEIIKDYKDYIEDNAVFSQVEINQFAKKWNYEADLNPTGITNGVKLGNKKKMFMVFSRADIKLGDEIELTLFREGRDLSRLEYKNENFKMDQSKELLKEIIDILPGQVSEEQYINAINEFNLSCENKRVSGIKGFKLEFLQSADKGKISFKTTCNYIYREGLMNSENVTGLDFGITMEYFYARYNELYSEAKKKRNTKYYKNFASDEEYISVAELIVSKNLKSPSSAVYVDARVIDRDAYGRGIVLLAVDAENSFGAMVRTYFCIVIRGINSDGTGDYNESTGIITYDAPSQEYDVVEYMKKQNNFGEPDEEEPTEELSSKNFIVTEHSTYHVYDSGFYRIFVDKYLGRIFYIELLLPKKYLNVDNIEDYAVSKQLAGIIFAAATNSTTTQVEHNLVKLYEVYGQSVNDAFYEEGVLYEAIELDNYVKFSMMAVDKLICEENNYKTEAILRLLSD